VIENGQEEEKAFPQNSLGNPTMTILAMAYRAAGALVDRYLKHPGALA